METITIERDEQTGRIKDRFSLYAFWKSEVQSACKYYRIDVPLRGLSENSFADGIIDTSGKDENSFGHMLEADIVLWYAQGGVGPSKMVDFIRTKATKQLRRKYPGYVPPTMIFDIDDNIDWVHPFNPSFASMGTRNIDGVVLVPGDTVMCKTDKDEDKVLWEDRVTRGYNGLVFDVRRNHAFIESNRAFAREYCSGMTVPSKHMAEYVKEHWGIKNTYVYPNSIVPDDWLPQYDVVSPYADKVTILWQGGDSHYQDLYVIKDALAEVAKKYPNTMFIFWGANFPYIYDHIPKDQFRFEPWVEYSGYRLKRIFMRSDINLCPLVDNEFNRAKSAIKWYEASVLTRPEATLAQRTSPYKDEIEDGKTGLLYDGPSDFVEKLSKLIEDAELRKTLGENSKKQVLATRDYRETAKGHFEFIQECRARERFGLES